jgi:hypothetical protein
MGVQYMPAFGACHVHCPERAALGRLAGSDLAEVAEQIWVEERWRDLEPEVAAVQWLRQGIPTVS